MKMTDEAKKSTVHSFLRYQDEKNCYKMPYFWRISSHTSETSIHMWASYYYGVKDFLKSDLNFHKSKA